MVQSIKKGGTLKAFFGIVIRQFLLAVSVAFCVSASVFAQSPSGLGIPDYVDRFGVPVYEIYAASTDSSFDRANQANLHVNGSAYGDGYNFWIRYSDGKYEKGVTDGLGFPVLSGVIVDSISYQLFYDSDSSNYAYVLCGSAPRIIINGYWVNWVVLVGGQPYYGSDFQVTSIETTEGACGGFP